MSWLMNIYPERGQSAVPVDDEYTQLAQRAWREAKAGKARWRGCHTCVCGERSDNGDWSVRGMTTNSLLVHYVRWHREEVPQEELDKLKAFYENL